MTDQAAPSRAILTAAVADILIVVTFVAAGRRSHDENGAWGAVEVAAPFLIGLALGWVCARGWRAPFAVRTGMIVWAITLVSAMLLRRTLFERGTALAFVIVAAAFLLLLPAWRLVVSRRRDS